MRDEHRLALEMETRLQRLRCLLEAAARALRSGDTMQLREVPSEGGQRHRPVGARGRKPLELGQRRLRIAAADRLGEIVERRLGGIADDRLDVFGLDALAALRVERKLDDLRA